MTLAISGDAPDELLRDLQSRLQALPDGPAAARVRVDPPRPAGIDVEILENFGSKQPLDMDSRGQLALL